MRILGIDPGLATTGFAILDVAKGKKKLLTVGVIRTLPRVPFAQRLLEIYKDFRGLLAEYKPDISSIEQIFFSKATNTAIPVAQARGVIILALQEAKVEIREYTPSGMKRALTGDGKADKKSIQKMVLLELGLSQAPEPDDAADALSLALSLACELR